MWHYCFMLEVVTLDHAIYNIVIIVTIIITPKLIRIRDIMVSNPLEGHVSFHLIVQCAYLAKFSLKRMCTK